MLSYSESMDRMKFRNNPVKDSKKDQRSDTEKDGEVFEITDFTTASDWERIIARFEDVIHDWKLPHFVPETVIPKDAFSKWKWTSSGTDIADVPDFEFNIKRIRLREACDATEDRSALEASRTSSRPNFISKTCFSVDEFPAVLEQILSTDNDFPFSDAVPPLARWFGITDMLIASPSSFNSLDQVVNENRLKLLMSSICIAVSNSRCPIPFFLQFDEMSRNMFVGISESFGYRTHYDIIDLERVPERLQTLTGLVEIFKEKIGAGSESNLIKASIKLTVKLNPDTVDSEGISDEDELLQKSFSLGSLPFGSLEYEGFVIHLFASWPNANAEAIEDTSTHSDLDPLQAPSWSAQLILNDRATYSLAESMKNFAKQMNRKESIKSLLEYLDPEVGGGEVKDQTAEALKRLTGDQRDPLRSRLSKAFYSRLPKYHLPVPIDSDSLHEILAYLFPDSDLAKDLKRTFPVLEDIDDPMLRSLKAAPSTSLTFRLALAIWYVFETFNGALAVAYLWQEIVLEFRYRWENCFLVPGIDEGSPNFATCLFNQKLQMLNCCIKKRQSGLDRTCEAPYPSSSSSSEYFNADAPEVTDDEDEFFDCEEDSTAISTDAKLKKPEGRLHQMGSLTLIREPEVGLFIPITQEPAPMTEDVVSDHLDQLAATDDSDEGRALRAKLQSAALVSDMAAFKAANPGCIFEDFVRWHSPRDWEESDSEDGGHLSERMGLPGSAWLDAWDHTDAKSVRRQKRLFDERVEAEKVLSFLDMTLGDIFKHLLPVFLKAGLIRLTQEMRSADLKYPHNKVDLFKSASRLFAQPLFSYIEFEKCLRLVRLDEQIICCHRKLQDFIKKSQVKDDDDTFNVFLRSLIETRQLINIPGGARSPIGQNLAACFDQIKSSKIDSTIDPNRRMIRRKLPPPIIREFILRTVAPRPFSISRPGVHRMYISLRSNEVRIAGAFTEDLLNG